MNTQNEILGLENKYWQAMKDQDVEAAVSLTRFPCLVTGPMGTRKISEKEYRGMMTKSATDSYKDAKIISPEVEFLNENTAVISYSTSVNGMDMLDVSTWIKEGGKWLCAFHSENPRGKPH